MRANLASYKPSTSEGFRIIGALMLREIKTRFGDNHLGFVWLFIEPLLLIVPLLLFWRSSGSPIHTLPFTEFMLTGYPPYMMWRSCVSRSQAAITGNSGLLYHRMVTPGRIVLARCLLEIAATLLCVTAIYVVFIYFDLVRPPAQFPLFLFGWLYMAAVAWSGAVFASALGEASRVIAKMIGTISFLMLGIGGTFYMVEWMPLSFQKYVVWIPTVQAFEIIRNGYFGEGVITHWSVLNMLICFLVPAALGLHILNVAREHMELE